MSISLEVFIGAIVIGGGLLVVAIYFVLRSGEGVQERIQTYTQYENFPRLDSKSNLPGVDYNRIRIRLNSVMSIFYSEELHRKLVSANWRLTVTEFLLVRYGITLLIFFLWWLVTGLVISAVGVAAIVYILPGYFLRRSLRTRRAKFQDQLVNVLVLIGGAVRVGHSLLQSLDVVIDEMASPASDEFRRVRREVELGLSLKHALINLTNRMQNDDLNLVVTAININTQVGGNLTTMLTAVTTTIRDRIRLFGEIRVLTSYARYSSYILTLLPFAVTALLFVLNPTYISRLFEPTYILIVPGVALIGVLLGNIWIRRLAKIEV